MTVEPQPAGPTFARSARVNGTCTTYERIYIKNIYIYIFIYDEYFSQLYDKCGARSARQLENATALGLAYPAARIKTRSNLAVSDMYMSVFGKDATDSLYLLLCRYIRSQVTHRYVS